MVGFIKKMSFLIYHLPIELEFSSLNIKIILFILYHYLNLLNYNSFIVNCFFRIFYC